MITRMEILAESKIHSEHKEDWNIEALIKDLLWNVKSDTIQNDWSASTVACYQELNRRINQRYGSDGEEPDVIKHAHTYKVLRNLIEAQQRCSVTPLAPKKERNTYLRAFEDAMKVRTIIPDILLP